MTSGEDTEVVAVLVELPDTGASTLLRAARFHAAMEMLARSGYRLVLSPDHVTLLTKQSRRWWQRERKEA